MAFKGHLPEQVAKSRSLDLDLPFHRDEQFLLCVIRHCFVQSRTCNDVDTILSDYRSKFNLKNLAFPFKCDRIQKFLDQNRHAVRLTIRLLLLHGDGCIYPAGSYTNKKEDDDDEDLFLLVARESLENPIRTKMQQPPASGKTFLYPGFINSMTGFPTFQPGLKHADRFDTFEKVRAFSLCKEWFFRIKNKDSLLSISYGEEEEEAATAGQRNKKKKKKNRTTRFICKFCFRGHKTRRTRDEHERQCPIKNRKQRIEYPTEDTKTVEFVNFKNRFAAPLIGYLDFETYPASSSSSEEKTKRGGESFTKTEAIHVPYCYSFILVSAEGQVIYEDGFLGASCMKTFFSRLKAAEKTAKRYLQRFKKLKPLTPEEEEIFRTSKDCHICGKPLRRKTVDEEPPSFHDAWGRPDGKGKKLSARDAVRDHCHQTSKFLGAAHSRCNLNRWGGRTIKVMMHNGSSYDTHIIIRHLSSAIPTQKKSKGGMRDVIKILPRNSEKFRSVQIGSFTFVDSVEHLPAKMSTLAAELGEDHEFSIMAQMKALQGKEHHLKLLNSGKGNFPYERFTSLQQMKRAKRVPPISAFHSRLNESDVSQEDYQRTVDIFEAFQCHNMAAYGLLYCASDVFLLAEIFHRYRETVRQHFDLDPAW